MRKRKDLFSISIVSLLLISGMTVLISIPDDILPFNIVNVADASFAGGNGTISNPFQISNITQLQNVTNNLNAHYVLINDIDASSSKNWNNGSGFVPIASEGTPSTNYWNGPKFNGTFDGKGYEVKHLWINRSDDDYNGLFGMTGTTSFISNLILSDAYVLGNNYTGGLVGSSWGRIERCEVNGSITGSHAVGAIVGDLTYKPYTFGERGYLTHSESDCYVKGVYGVGGLVGYGDVAISFSNSSGTVNGEFNVGGLAGSYSLGSFRTCSSYCNVYGKRSQIGGLIGHSSGDVIDCHSKGDVIGEKDTNYIGGAFGFSYSREIINCSSTGDVFGGGGDIGGFSGINRCDITGCFSSGDVYSQGIPYGFSRVGKYTGGFVGRTTGFINNCFSSGDIFGYDHLGGFVGVNDGDNGYPYSKGNILNSYCLGKVHPTKNTDSGAFVGYNYSGKVERCFFLNESNDICQPVGKGSFVMIEPLTIEKMVNGSSFEDMDWDMDKVWNISRGYTSPFHRWEFNIPSTIISDDQTIASKGGTYYFRYDRSDINPTDIHPLWTLNTDADWLSFNDENVLVGIPGTDDTGPYFVNISIDDGRSGSDWHNFTLKINTSNNNPSIQTENNRFADEDYYYSSNYDCVEDEGDVLAWSMETNATFLEISQTSGTVFGTPLVDDIGKYLVNVSVHDGQGAVEWTEFNLTVNETNDDPIIISKDLEFSWETFWYGNLYNAQDEENDALNWSLTTNATWLTMNKTSGFLKGKPSRGDNSTYFVNITLGDIRGGISRRNFTLTIYSTIGSGNQTDPVLIWNSTHFRMIELDLDRNYKMICDIDAFETKVMNNGKGLLPIGRRFSAFTNTSNNHFTGSFNGNGFNITNLWINRPGESQIGLFHFMHYTSSIFDLGIINITVIGKDRVGAISSAFYGDDVKNIHILGNIEGDRYVGGFFGYLQGSVLNCEYEGTVNGQYFVGGVAGYNIGKITDTKFNCNVSGSYSVGGLVGEQRGNSIKKCSGIGNISGVNEVGGLIGFDNEGGIEDCHFSGSVAGTNNIGGLVGKHTGFYWGGAPGGRITLSSSKSIVNGRDYVGGFIGHSGGQVIDCFSTGNVNGNSFCGGFIGYTNEWVRTSNSSGDVFGIDDNVGGFIGKTTGEILKCFSTGDAKGKNYIGGFCGWSNKLIRDSFSYGNVSGNWYVGGLIGYADGDIENCFSTSKTTGSRSVGGLIGYSKSNTIMNCYSIGEVSGGWLSGGLVASYVDATNKNSFWDKETSRQNQSGIGTGLNTSDMIDSNTYINAGWDMNYKWNMVHKMSYPFFRWKSFNSPPSIEINGTLNVTEDFPFYLEFKRFDPDIIDVLGRWNILSNATWVTVDIPNGSVRGSPGNDDVGTYWINFTLEDGRGGSDSINVTLIIKNVNDDPGLHGEHVLIAFEDELYDVIYTPYDIDPTNDRISFNMSTNALWLNFDSDNGRIYGTPSQDDIGTYWVNLTLDDGIGGAYWDRFEIEVQNTNDAPYFIIQEFPDAIEDEPYELLVNAGDIDPTNDWITWELINTNLDKLRINKFSGRITFQPENDDVGEYWVNIGISDKKGGYTTNNFTIKIINVNDDPVIYNVEDQYLKEDMEFFIQLEGYDVDSDPVNFSWKIDPALPFAQIDQKSGNITGIPSNDDIGEWIFEITLLDGDEGEINYSFKVVVLGINDPPIVTKSIVELTFEEDSDGTVIDLAKYIYDEEGDDLIFLIEYSPNFTIINDGFILKISPKLDYSGIEELLIEAFDGLSTVHLILKINVIEKNDCPQIIDINIPDSAKDNETINMSCIVEDVDGDKFTFKWTSNITGDLGNFSVITTRLVAGTHNITLTVTDEFGASVERSTEILVERSASYMSGKDNENDGDNGKTPIIWIIAIVLFVVILVILGAFIYFLNNKNNDEEPPSPIEEPSLPSVETIEKESPSQENEETIPESPFIEPVENPLTPPQEDLSGDNNLPQDQVEQPVEPPTEVVTEPMENVPLEEVTEPMEEEETQIS